MNSQPLTDPIPSPPSLFTATLLAAVGFTAGAAAQVTDPAVLTSYGAGCGPTISGDDHVQADGSHLLRFVTSSDPFDLSLLVLGFDQTTIPLAGACNVLTTPLSVTAAVADASGDASFDLPLQAATIGTIYAQGATLDASMRIETSAGLEALLPGQSPTQDPTTSRRNPCYYIQNLTWNYPADGVPSVQGRVRWPSTTCSSSDGPVAGSPIVIFMHGNNMSFDDHDYLMAHLARNGFVACSIANGGYQGSSNEGRALQAISYLNAMHAYWGWSHRLSNDVVFMGHSRGGEAAITAARLLRDQPGLAHVPYDVEAVVSIAPTDGGADGTLPREDLTGDMAESFLGVYGSKDTDVEGFALQSPSSVPERTVFAIYDRAGTEDSVEGIVLPPAILTKSMVLVDGATHRGFLDGCTHSEGGVIGCDSHRDVARGYVNAFLRWRVFDEADHQAYFDGRATPTSLRIEQVFPHTQVSEPGRRVVDNLERLPWVITPTTIGGTLSSSGLPSLPHGPLHTMVPSAPHDTSGLLLRWQSAGAYTHWTIPDVVDPIVGNLRDMSTFTHISIRIAQVYQDPLNTPGQDLDCSFRLVSGGPANNWTPSVRLGDYARIAYPDPHVVPFPVGGVAAGDYTKSAMITVRVPLSAFSNFDPSSVVAVNLAFNVPGHEQGAVIVDSLEFVR